MQYPVRISFCNETSTTHHVSDILSRILAEVGTFSLEISSKSDPKHPQNVSNSTPPPPPPIQNEQLIHVPKMCSFGQKHVSPLTPFVIFPAPTPKNRRQQLTPSRAFRVFSGGGAGSRPFFTFLTKFRVFFEFFRQVGNREFVM